jgi:hypothetical protein
MFCAVKNMNQNHKSSVFLRNWPQTFFLPPGFFLIFIQFWHLNGIHLDATEIEMTSRWSPVGSHLLIGKRVKRGYIEGYIFRDIFLKY